MISIEIRKVKIGAVKLNPENPRRIGNADMERLCKSLKEFPDMMKLREIVVDETMTVLGGNMRLLALQKLQAKEVTAKIVNGLSKEQKREFMIKDNSNLGEWDMEILSAFDSLPLADWGVDIPIHWTGHDGEASEDLVEENKKPDIILCPKCGHQFSVMEKKKNG